MLSFSLNNISKLQRHKRYLQLTKALAINYRKLHFLQQCKSASWLFVTLFYHKFIQTKMRVHSYNRKNEPSFFNFLSYRWHYYIFLNGWYYFIFNSFWCKRRNIARRFCMLCFCLRFYNSKQIMLSFIFPK